MKRPSTDPVEIFVVHVVQPASGDVHGHATRRLHGVIEHVGTGELAEFSDGGELVAMVQTALVQKEAEVWREERT